MAIFEKALDKLKIWNLLIHDCRRQSMTMAQIMTGAYMGVQARIHELNKFALFLPCGEHSLNLVGLNAAECCPTVITYFGSVQKLLQSSKMGNSLLKY